MKHKIEIIHWDYKCADGCCYDYGVALKLNGEEINQYVDNNLEETIRLLLEKLGVESEVVMKEDYTA